MGVGDSSTGLVVLVGAGPGAEQFLTLAGAKWLSQADVVIYDRLVNPDLLRLARPEAERLYVGKTPGGAGPDQRWINDLLIRRARAGERVVRLKGGDPLVFGRGGEEAEALAAAKVPYRIVPGITAAAAAAACAGIPLTDRRYGSTLALVTGRQDPAKPSEAVNWRALAGIDTVVFYMGVGNLPEIARRLIEAGRDPQTPAAVVAMASTPQQKTVTAPLAELPATARRAGIAPPALTFVGEVVTLREKLTWFERLPLFAQTVIVTRPAHQAQPFSARLRELGAAVIEAAAVEIQEPADFAPVDSALRRLAEFDWVVFTSVNGVEVFVRRCRHLGLDARALCEAKVAAVGPATAAALRAHFIVPDLIPDEFTTRALGEAVKSAGRLAGRRVLLARADIASDALRLSLTAAAAEVEEVAFYHNVRPERLPEDAASALGEKRVDWITFSSSSSVGNFLALASEANQGPVGLEGVRLAAIGPVTAEALRSHGLEPTVVARQHTMAGLVEAILEAVGAQGRR
jgi:uroporphyrinogen III methyltransferase/synthase